MSPYCAKLALGNRDYDLTMFAASLPKPVTQEQGESPRPCGFLCPEHGDESSFHLLYIPIIYTNNQSENGFL